MLLHVGVKLESLILRKDHRLRVFNSWMLRKILRVQQEEVTGGWRKLHIEELHDFCSSPITICEQIK
jgi:hypothetical protein